jgi:chromosome partitioning protein
VRVSEAPSHGKPVLLYDLKCSGAQAYLKLAAEVIQRERREAAPPPLGLAAAEALSVMDT